MKQRYILVIRADRTLRIARKPRLAWDEIGVAIVIDFPDGWGTVIGNIDLTAPTFDPNITYVPAIMPGEKS